MLLIFSFIHITFHHFNFFIFFFLGVGRASTTERFRIWIANVNDVLNINSQQIVNNIRNIDAESYGSSTPTDYSQYLRDEGLDRSLEPLTQKRKTVQHEQNQNVIPVAMTVDDVSSAEDEFAFSPAASQISWNALFEDLSLFDVMTFQNAACFRADARFRRICVKPFAINGDKPDQTSAIDLANMIYCIPHDVVGSKSFRFWTSVWWRFLYDQHYTITAYMNFGNIPKSERDMFRVVAKLGPDEFNYMHPDDFLQVNELIAPVHWNCFVGVAPLLQNRFD